MSFQTKDYINFLANGISATQGHQGNKSSD